MEITNALIQMEQKNPNPMKRARAIHILTLKVKDYYDTFKKKVENYIELVERSGLKFLDRIKLLALITIEEHNREVIEKLNA